MSLYTAIRYHDNMLVFDHYKDGYEETAEGGSEASGCSQKDSGVILEHLSASDLQDKSELDLNIEQVGHCSQCLHLCLNDILSSLSIICIGCDHNCMLRSLHHFHGTPIRGHRLHP